MPTNKRGEGSEIIGVSVSIEESALIDELRGEMKPPAFLRHVLREYLRLTNPKAEKRLVEIRRKFEQEQEMRREAALLARFPHLVSSGKNSSAISIAKKVIGNRKPQSE